MKNPVKHFLSVDDFSLSDYAAIFEEAAAFKKEGRSCIAPASANKLVSLLFAQPSPRTSLSYDKAAKLCGYQVAQIFTETSAVARSESFDDVMCMTGLGSDLIVVRHPVDGNVLRHVADHVYPLYEELAAVPIVNAGCRDEHPTQALMDLFTIHEAFGRLDIKIGFYGDLSNSHIVRSLLRLISRFGAQVICVAGDIGLEVPEALLDEVQARSGHRPVVKSVMEPFLGEIDVLYVTRLYKEITPDEVHHKFGGQFTPYRVRPEWLKQMRDDAIIMHALPRFDELPVEIDQDKRARYMTQAYNGIFTRMALMRHCMGVSQACLGERIQKIS